jgi:tetratricopeptide (TPR) repeat protein/thiol-disulfide isomerase/thioredoxin
MKLRNEIITALLALAVAAGASTAAASTLKVGDPAPKLQTGKWMQGEPVQEFSPGKAYLVEFWATWCGPCRVSIPHLNEIHKQYKDKGLVVIGQDCWEQDDNLVAPFIKTMGEKMTYRVALDDKNGSVKGKMAENWMEAAGQNGIPTAFLVDTTGHIAWIGHPMVLKEQLIEEVLAGKFDLQKAAAQYAQEQNTDDQLNKASALARDGKLDEAEQPLNRLLAEANDAAAQTAKILGFRAEMRARAGRWKEAIADYSKLMELAPNDFTITGYYELAALLVQSGDLDGYRQHCARTLKRFGTANDYLVGETVVQACLFVPSSGVDLAELGGLAQMAVTKCPANDEAGLVNCQFAKGLADYRQGQFSSAAERMLQALAGYQKGRLDIGIVQSWMLLAMAQYQLHQTNQARSSFVNVMVIEETKLPKLGSGDLGGEWSDWIFAQAIVKEGRELIEGQTSDADLSARIDRARTALTLKEEADKLAIHGQWKEAAGDCAKAVEAQPDDDVLCYSLAALLVQSGDLEGYRRHCARVLARFGTTRDPVTAGRLAKECLILPGSGVDLEALGQLAETAVTEGSSNADFPYFQFDKGLAEYRQGRFAGAVEWEQEVAAGTLAFRNAQAWMVLAMAHWQLKQPDEAHAALAKGVELIDTKLPKLESGNIGPDWRNWIVAHALMKEAKELIEGPMTVK